MKRLLAALAAIAFALPVAAVELGDDGLHKPDWFHFTFKDLREDFADARVEDKRLLLIVEQIGCIYCKEMHETTYQDERVLKMLREDYYPVQINLHADTELIDVDGEALTEKQAARKWGILFTPTMIFLPTEPDSEKSVAQQAVAVMPGAFSAGTTFDLMTWVKEERYLDTSEEDFQRYHARMIRERTDGGTQ